MTGATGGVGSVAIAALSRLGYDVTAITGKDDAHEYLQSLGASEVLSRTTLVMGTRPLEAARWAGAVDAAGGDLLAWLTRTTNHWGGIASTGLTGGVELRTTVMPFILRGVALIGIDSAMCPMDIRMEVWRRLATDMKPRDLERHCPRDHPRRASFGVRHAARGRGPRTVRCQRCLTYQS